MSAPTDTSVVDLLKARGESEHKEAVSVIESEATSAFAKLLFVGDVEKMRAVGSLITKVNDGDAAVLNRIAAGTGTIDDKVALQALLDSDKLPEGAKKAILMIASDKIKVEPDGTISDVKRLSKELEGNPDPSKPAMSAELAKLIGEVKTTTDKLVKQREKLTALRLALDNTNTSRIKLNKDSNPLSATAKEAEAFDKAIEAERLIIVELIELNTKIAAELAKPAS
jgi:hypothetical protein